MVAGDDDRQDLVTPVRVSLFLKTVPYYRKAAGLAQSIERQTLNLVVGGSARGFALPDPAGR